MAPFLFGAIADRWRAHGVTKTVTLADRITADHDRALAERRAARPARRHAGEVGHAAAEDRAARLAADPILQNRDRYIGARA